MVHGMGNHAEILAALCEHWEEGWANWIGVSGVASLTCWGYVTLLDRGVWVACLTCWGISQPYPAMKMLLLKQCMRNSMTL